MSAQSPFFASQAKQHAEAGGELGAAEDHRVRSQQREDATGGGGGLAEGARGGPAGREGQVCHPGRGLQGGRWVECHSKILA